MWIYRLLFLFVYTVTDFSGEDKASGIKFCTVVQERPGQGISHFRELCSLRSSKSDESTRGGARPGTPSACVANRQSPSLAVLVLCSVSYINKQIACVQSACSSHTHTHTHTHFPCKWLRSHLRSVWPCRDSNDCWRIVAVRSWKISCHLTWTTYCVRWVMRHRSTDRAMRPLAEIVLSWSDENRARGFS